MTKKHSDISKKLFKNTKKTKKVNTPPQLIKVLQNNKFIGSISVELLLKIAPELQGYICVYLDKLDSDKARRIRGSLV